jgi:hypothetical protein
MSAKKSKGGPVAMTEDEKKQIAVFCFSVIHEFVGSMRLDYGEKQHLLAQKCARKWQIPGSDRTRISRATILSWVKRYKEGGGKLESLYPKDRHDKQIGSKPLFDIRTYRQLRHRCFQDLIVKHVIA